MRRITVVNNVTLDGVMQAPGRPDEDDRGGFSHGGWALPYDDEVKAQVMGQGMAHGGSLLFGRRTYEDFYRVWPGRTNNPFTDVLNRRQKYVVSNTLAQPLPWANSRLLNGDALDSVNRLKAEPGDDVTILGSGELVRALFGQSLIDEYLLLIHPLVLGGGRRLFPEDRYATLHLTDSVTTTTGVIIATYTP